MNVTGAFGYTGKYGARWLLMLGEPVITLTGDPLRPNKFGAAVKVFPFRLNARFSSAIVRPTVVFGVEDILINNIAFLLRRLPVFIIPGTGQYRLQPVHVEDLARIVVEAAHSSGNMVIDAVGPDILSLRS